MIAPIIMVGLLVGACSSKPLPVHTTPTVVFWVGGDYSAAGNSANAPWQSTITLASGSSYVTAAGSSTVTCRILVNNVLVSEAQATGPGATARCAFNS